MTRFVLRRLAAMVPTLFGITLVTFALVKLAPGDPVTLELEGGMRAGAVSARVVEDFRRAFFLDLPLFVNLERKIQAMRWHGNWWRIRNTNRLPLCFQSEKRTGFDPICAYPRFRRRLNQNLT